MSLRTIVSSLLGDETQEVPSVALRVVGASRTDVGLQRSKNEDCVAFLDCGSELGSLAVVADGMGGARGGAVASDLAVRTICDVYLERGEASGQVLRDALLAANTEIFECAKSNADLKGMGTTCVAAAVVGHSLWAAWTGDARLYLYRNEGLYQLSQDDTVVAEMVRSGRLSADAARAHEDRHVLTRSLGTRPLVEVGTLLQPVALRPQDKLLLCTDGVHDVLDDFEVGAILQRHGPAESLEALIQECNRRGGYDNASAVLMALVTAETNAVPE